MFTLNKNTQANESLSKFKLLSAYGGAGSILHTQYGSIIVSCIEEWGFLNRIDELHVEAITINEKDINRYVRNQAALPREGGIEFSNDDRFISLLKEKKKIDNLKYLVLIPDLDLNEKSNTVDFGSQNLTIASTYMPKVFSDSNYILKSYSSWHSEWIEKNKDDKYAKQFFPVKKKVELENGKFFFQQLKQDNLVLICPDGHISDFPWSKYLKWRIQNPHDLQREIELFSYENCCIAPKLSIRVANSNASGFDGKWLKCENKGCCGSKGTSLKGLFSIKVLCPGHKPWEASVSDANNNSFLYSGSTNSRRNEPPREKCSSTKAMKVALTTGNNLYFSRIMSSIYLPSALFKNQIDLDIEKLEREKKAAADAEDFALAIDLQNRIIELKALPNDVKEVDEAEQDLKYKFEEFSALNSKTDDEINIDIEHLKVKDTTVNLNDHIRGYFSKILRVDNMKMTSTQLDFSRVEPFDPDQGMIVQEIFRRRPEEVISYPAIENYGEGIFFSLNQELIDEYEIVYRKDLDEWILKLPSIRGSFSRKIIEKALNENWRLYMIHTLSHIIMRELEFRSGYPTASLQERLYVSNHESYKMAGFLIYTVEGSEGSMGGLIAQTTEKNLNSLIKSALTRATICQSDPLCWTSEGQGLFNLNFASCFSCGLVSETSCEERNLYLDRKLLVDQDFGFFKEVLDLK
ncbi:DrmB family protein [Sphingobacterium sp.]|uniref:DrmB family protein n=1 Tax=Sphingobacterium sp. TaxID=341027 RepID=UPI0028ACAAA7|nr:DrmB family protein [Sphingobacterium sp.]